MRRFALFLGAGAAIACARPETETTTDTGAPVDTAAAAITPAPAPTPISLADVAGRWNVRATTTNGEVVTYQTNATGSRSGWTFTPPNRRPVPVRVVAVAGDSIITEAGPFESILRPGVQVRSRSVVRIQNGQLVGTTVARFVTTGPDSIAYLTFRGTRAP
jgi:hypothetical protein